MYRGFWWNGRDTIPSTRIKMTTTATKTNKQKQNISMLDILNHFDGPGIPGYFPLANFAFSPPYVLEEGLSRDHYQVTPVFLKYQFIV